MMNSIFPFFYGFAVLILLWQAFRIMARGHNAQQFKNRKIDIRNKNLAEDRTGLLTVHPELLDNEGKITEEELLTVRFSGDNDSNPSSETSAE